MVVFARQNSLFAQNKEPGDFVAEDIKYAEEKIAESNQAFKEEQRAQEELLKMQEEEKAALEEIRKAAGTQDKQKLQEANDKYFAAGKKTDEAKKKYKEAQAKTPIKRDSAGRALNNAEDSIKRWDKWFEKQGLSSPRKIWDEKLNSARSQLMEDEGKSSKAVPKGEKPETGLKEEKVPEGPQKELQAGLGGAEERSERIEDKKLETGTQPLQTQKDKKQAYDDYLAGKITYQDYLKIADEGEAGKAKREQQLEKWREEKKLKQEKLKKEAEEKAKSELAAEPPPDIIESMQEDVKYMMEKIQNERDKLAQIDNDLEKLGRLADEDPDPAKKEEIAKKIKSLEEEKQSQQLKIANLRKEKTDKSEALRQIMHLRHQKQPTQAGSPDLDKPILTPQEGLEDEKYLLSMINDLANQLLVCRDYLEKAIYWYDCYPAPETKENVESNRKTVAEVEAQLAAAKGELDALYRKAGKPERWGVGKQEKPETQIIYDAK
jgi:DNA repair exonuclease SbcCD ATPase subunit